MSFVAIARSLIGISLVLSSFIFVSIFSFFFFFFFFFWGGGGGWKGLYRLYKLFEINITSCPEAIEIFHAQLS